MTDPHHVDASQQVGAAKLPTMQDVATLAGVSRQLVSLVVRGEPGPSEASREKVQRAAAELGFVAHASARQLRQSNSRLIGIEFTMQNAFHAAFTEQIITALTRHGYHAALGPRTAERGTDAVLRELLERRVEALVSFNPNLTSTVMATAMKRLPVVWLGERASSSICDNVHVDDVQGLHQAVEHLYRLGHRRISYAGGLVGVAGPDRRAAYEMAMVAHGLAEYVDVLPGGFGEEDGARAAAALLDRRGPRSTALVCSSDQAAAGALAVFFRRGVSVPHQMSVVGFDDGRVASLSYNDLTSVRQDVTAGVSATTRLLMSRLAGDTSPPRVVQTSTSLTVRSSTGAAWLGADCRG